MLLLATQGVKHLVISFVSIRSVKNRCFTLTLNRHEVFPCSAAIWRDFLAIELRGCMNRV